MLSQEREKFRAQRKHARARKIEFEFSFEEWVAWWKKQLGPDWLNKRGRQNNNYCMARKGDKGSYRIGNVKCITTSQNLREMKQRIGWKHSKASRLKMSKSHKGQFPTLEARKKMSLSRSGKPLSDEHRKNISLGQIGRVQSKETRAKISRAKTGKALSEEHIKAISKSQMGNTHAAGNHKPKSELHRQRISQALRKFWGKK